MQFRTFRPVYLCIVACRVATGPVFATAPRQSDYVRPAFVQAGRHLQSGTANESMMLSGVLPGVRATLPLPTDGR